VASPLEQSINGVENSLYMFSQATPDGVMTLTVTFKLGTDVDKAQVQVQNRVARCWPSCRRKSANWDDDDQAIARPDHGRASVLAHGPL
jgi:multidrug efflux pump subunit AcrB